jgi:hypothetical protein
MDTLRFPIKFDNNKQMSKLTENTDAYIKQLISFCILTEPFSLPLSPDFGVADPSFSTVSPDRLMLAANKFIPEVTIVAVDSNIDNEDGRVNVRFIYNR